MCYVSFLLLNYLPIVKHFFFCLFCSPYNRPNTDRIYLCVGLDCFVELTLDEALKFIDRKTGILKKSMELLAENSAKIKAHIKIVLNLIDQLKNGGGDDGSC